MLAISICHFPHGIPDTQYIYCDKCWQAAKKVLLAREKTICSTVIPGWGNTDEITIIAGKVGGEYPGGELALFSNELIPQLEALICHEVRIAVLPESGTAEIMVAHPKS